MSKKFDEEYQAFFEDNTPDLWDRIDSRLDPNPVREIPKKTRAINSKKILYFAVPAAAVLLALVILPNFLRDGGRYTMSLTGSTNDAAVAYDMGMDTSANATGAEETTTEEAAIAEIEEEEFAEGSTEKSYKGEFVEDDTEDEEMLLGSQLMVAGTMTMDCLVTVRSVLSEEETLSYQLADGYVDIYIVEVRWNEDGLSEWYAEMDSAIEEPNVYLVETKGVILSPGEKYHVLLEDYGDGIFLLSEMIDD